MADWYGANGDAIAINEAIARLVATRRNVHEIDWNSLLEHGGATRWLMADHLHPNGRGRAELATLYRQALDEDCGA